ncbi:MAG: hypothetical protein Faunusvirus16_15 [Faunusvirus sp.]|jgi:hypothetical protein|uniref:Sel1 repeat family protein n=1 Tax=Faunusvirus sp. TaxID=2487766 RepID=A0A3G4ZZN9_9VIRU|nr:MAG: hypothetical protein Faunusvirus16_15 [Faunusvirus sp.]
MTDEIDNIVIKNENDALEIYMKGIICRDSNDTENMIKYYKLAANFGHTGAIVKLGQYYHSKKMYDDMLLYYFKGVALNDSYSMVAIAEYYKFCHNYGNMIKYYMMAFDIGDVCAIKDLANHYFEQQDYDCMCECYLMAVERHKDIDSMDELADHYEDIKKYDDMLKYCHMVLDNTPSDMHSADYNYRKFALQRLARYYRECKKYDKMMEYYDILVKNGDTDTFVNLADYYKITGNVALMTEYYIKAIRCGYTSAIMGLGDYYIDNKLMADGLKMFAKLQYEIYIICEENTIFMQKYISKFLDDSTTFANFFNEYGALLDSLKKKDDYIEELEIMPEGPKYAEAKERFNKNATILKCMDNNKINEGLDED